MSRIVELQDADFFNQVHIEDRDFLVLVVPEHCEECHALTTEFQQHKDEIAQKFPDLSLGYVYEHSTSNVLVRRTMDVPTKPITLIVKALIKNRLYLYSGMKLGILQTYLLFRNSYTNPEYISQIFFLLGKINVKRLSKWIKETLESSSGDDRAQPKGVIQMDLSLLHHLTKEAKHDLNMLLVPASKFITVSIYN